MNTKVAVGASVAKVRDEIAAAEFNEEGMNFEHGGNCHTFDNEDEVKMKIRPDVKKNYIKANRKHL